MGSVGDKGDRERLRKLGGESGGDAAPPSAEGPSLLLGWVPRAFPCTASAFITDPNPNRSTGCWDCVEKDPEGQSRPGGKFAGQVFKGISGTEGRHKADQAGEKLGPPKTPTTCPREVEWPPQDHAGAVGLSEAQPSPEELRHQEEVRKGPSRKESGSGASRTLGEGEASRIVPFFTDYTPWSWQAW